jgi:hypothetical protein
VIAGIIQKPHPFVDGAFSDLIGEARFCGVVKVGVIGYPSEQTTLREGFWCERVESLDGFAGESRQDLGEGMSGIDSQSPA